MASKFRYKNSKIWWLKWYQNRKAHYESTHTRDRAIAEYLLAKKQQEMARGSLPAALKKVSFPQAYADYLDYCKATKTPRTVKNDTQQLQYYFRNHPMPALLRDFDSREYENYIYGRVSKKEISPITGTGSIRAMKAFFSWCVSRELLDKNPLSRVKTFRKVEYLPRYLSSAEIRRMRVAAKDNPIYPLLETAIYAGLRESELLSLEWKDVNFKKGYIAVVNKIGNKNEVTFTTKSKKSRTIPLHDNLRKILLKYRRPEGLCFDSVNLRRNFEKVKKLSGFKHSRKKAAGDLPRVNLKCLRHTFGAYCAMSGVPIPLLKEWMGHASINTTMIYAKLRPDSCPGQIQGVKFG